MGGLCCGQKEEFQGSPFFKKIDITLEKTGHKDLDDIFLKMDDPLVKSEEVRKKLANSFKEMITVTGTCVLKRPDLEQCIRAWLIRFIADVKKATNDKGASGLENLSFNDILVFTDKSPFIVLDEKKIELLKSTIGVNPNVGSLHVMKEAIVAFFVALKEMELVFEEYKKEIEELKKEVTEFIEVLRKNFMTYGIKSSWEYILIGKRNIIKIFDVSCIIDIFKDMGAQITEALNIFSHIVNQSENCKEYEELALKVMNKNINDMKLLVWNTTNEAKLNRIEDWQTNFTYIQVGQMSMNEAAE